MAQYKTGTCNVTNGSTTITGYGTSWSTQVLVGHTFKVKDINTVYQITAVTSNTQISISPAYAGTTATGVEYQITRDFTANLGLTEISVGDLDWPYHLTQGVIRKIDNIFAAGGGTGINVDLLDDQHGSYYLNCANFTGTLSADRLPTSLPGRSVDMVDSFHASQTPGANQIPVLNSSGRLVLDGTDDGASKIQTGGVIKAGSLILLGGELIGPSSLKIHPNTSDGADSGVSCVCGGGWPIPSRGGFLEVRGNESASYPGDVRIVSGGDSTFGNVSLFTGGGYERFRITPSGRILTSPTYPLPTDNGVDALQVNGTIASTGYKLSALNTAPTSASATGTQGEIRITADAIYICTATNTWKRATLATW